IAENIDWVLKPNTDYYRLDGTTDTKVFTTNSSGIVNFGGGSSLLVAIDSSGSTNWWTGLANDWTFYSACTGNNWSFATGLASKGVGASVTNTSIDTGGLSTCSFNFKLLCVRQ
ncbi:MAG: DUF1554 domain-containing protein, partial [Leptospiraceae bacterium]|nr:DUF1554 domain-containing protein [Leptospiraceae bacterium]